MDKEGIILEQEQSVSALILAAGTASRMGKTKQVLPIDGKPILQHVLEQVGQLERLESILVVLGHDAKHVQDTITLHDPRMSWYRHDRFKEGQGTSLKAGMMALLKRSKHMMVFLADMPMICPETIQLIYDAGVHWQEPGEASYMVRPTYEGRIGHPVFFGNIRPDMLDAIHGDEGGKGLVKQLAFRKHIDVEDHGVVWDLDTIAAYEVAVKHWGKRARNLF